MYAESIQTTQIKEQLSNVGTNRNKIKDGIRQYVNVEDSVDKDIINNELEDANTEEILDIIILRSVPAEYPAPLRENI